MCKVLKQIYACDHSKPICITACPRALAKPQPSPFPDSKPPHLHHQSPPARQPSPSIPPTTPAPPVRSPSATVSSHPYADLPSYDASITYCTRIFPHNLSPSKYPCLRCYLQPDWAQLRGRWIREYRATHPGTQREHLDELSGVGLIAETVGLVNVVEVSRDLERRGLGRGGDGVEDSRL